MNRTQWVHTLQRTRAEAALTAYKTALLWVQTYPTREVERRLIEMIAEKRATVTPAASEPS